MIYGYARVSSIGQKNDGNSLEDQVKRLKEYGCGEIYEEAFTGKTMDRPKFQELLSKLESGDTLVVSKLDRFARTTINGVQTVQDLFNKGVKVHILNMGLVEDTNIGRLILTVMLAFAEYERGIIVERTQTGKAIARLNPGFKDGRPRKFSKAQLDHACSLLSEGYSYNEVAAMSGISRSTLIRERKRLCSEC